MKTVKQKYLSGERALFKSSGIMVEDCVFADGESPLKESKNIDIQNSVFKWKYPLWYCEHVNIKNSNLLETARSGIWYTNHIKITNSMIDAPKTFRRGHDITLEHVHMANALESFWNCRDVQLHDVHVKGDYFGMHSEDVYAEHVSISGNYCFDGAKNIEIHHATLLSKDAFWNCENVTVYDSTIIGEYLGWNSKNITFINCTIESLQGLCYIENLKMVNCKIINSSLLFEFSTIDVRITSHIDSIVNPISGSIQAQSIGEVIMNADMDSSLTEIMETNKIMTQNVDEMMHCIC